MTMMRFFEVGGFFGNSFGSISQPPTNDRGTSLVEMELNLSNLRRFF